MSPRQRAICQAFLASPGRRLTGDQLAHPEVGGRRFSGRILELRQIHGIEISSNRIDRDHWIYELLTPSDEVRRALVSASGGRTPRNAGPGPESASTPTDAKASMRASVGSGVGVDSGAELGDRDAGGRTHPPQAPAAPESQHPTLFEPEPERPLSPVTDAEAA
jgi:hypothetical protein